MSLRPRKVDFAEQWAFLRDCFEKTLTMEGTEGVHGADVRLAVYQLCECPDPHPFCEELYYAIKAFLEDHVRAVAAELALSEARSEPLLGRFLQQWDVYAVGIRRRYGRHRVAGALPRHHVGEGHRPRLPQPPAGGRPLAAASRGAGGGPFRAER
eukprot:CAMPEP_0114629346 /NCGR_PEP_ID=MMETSP0168-20121206/13309_1 /TAXON_ID=95228 ORGANISM="Vannella sp., Strain DIVA3 517/6/12" /NCGR_SAMPLE_ID=MMETSP0168 /ASSEMBLY_ACC=CAM_ASM_000044 /LENGTH=154 /DNA_ID=CAMNT_0001840797 /DNA_START=32 /DNA_END=492 /DNA_ORIENTATION=+